MGIPAHKDGLEYGDTFGDLWNNNQPSDNHTRVIIKPSCAHVLCSIIDGRLNVLSKPDRASSSQVHQDCGTGWIANLVLPPCRHYIFESGLVERYIWRFDPNDLTFTFRHVSTIDVVAHSHFFLISSYFNALYCNCSGIRSGNSTLNLCVLVGNEVNFYLLRWRQRRPRLSPPQNSIFHINHNLDT